MKKRKVTNPIAELLASLIAKPRTVYLGYEPIKWLLAQGYAEVERRSNYGVPIYKATQSGIALYNEIKDLPQK